MSQDNDVGQSALDPLKFDALLSAFETAGTAAPWSSQPGVQDLLAQNTMPSFHEMDEPVSAFHQLLKSIEGYPQPCLAVSETGQIVALNGRAHTAFDLEVSDHIDACGIETVDETPLSAKIAALIPEARDGTQTRFCRATYRPADRPVLLAIVPNSAQHGLVRTALVFFVDIGWDEAIAKFISRAYDLSKAEEDIIEMFTFGKSLEQIAQARGRSLRTVRTQFYSALGKCGLSSQTDLVREVVTGAMFQGFAPRIANAANHPHRRELRLLRPGGRSLEVVASGDFSGNPVFMVASLGVQKFAPQKTRKFHDAGLCVYAISPPGLGYTDPPPPGMDWTTCLAEDVRFFMDQLQVPAAPFAAFGANLLMTVRLANRIPDRMSGIQSWITIPPTRFQHMSGFAKTVNAVSAMGNASLVSATAKNLVARSGLRAWAVLGTRKMAKIQTRPEPEIAEKLLDPETIQAIDEGFKSAIRQGFSPMIVRTAESIHSDWFADAQACTVPLLLVHGVKDKTNSIASIRSFAAALPDKITLVEIEDGAGFLHVTHEDLHIAFMKGFAQGRGLKL